MVCIPDKLAARLAAEGGGLERRALEGFALATVASVIASKARRQ
jgi:hypothetical protein